MHKDLARSRRRLRHLAELEAVKLAVALLNVPLFHCAGHCLFGCWCVLLLLDGVIGIHKRWEAVYKAMREGRRQMLLNKQGSQSPRGRSVIGLGRSW